MSYGLSEWHCQSCSTLIKCDFIKIQVIWLAGLVVFGALFGFMSNYFDLGLLNFIFLIPFFVFALLSLYYAAFEKV